MRPVWIVAVLAVGLGLAQQAAKDKPKPAPKPKEPPKQESSGGLFKNKLGYQSSKQSKDSMTLGFNGIDPSGRVDKEMLDKQPTSADQAAVAKMKENRPSEPELQAFLRQGGLK